jgi:hypothetical protein
VLKVIKTKEEDGVLHYTACLKECLLEALRDLFSLADWVPDICVCICPGKFATANF